MRRARSCVLTALVAVVAYGACIAQAAEQAKPFAAPQAASPAAPAGAGGLVQVTLSLLLVLAAVFAAAWAMRRLRALGRPGAGAVEILADAALGPKERAVLVQVGKQQLLLGVTSAQVNTLHVLTENVRVDGARPRKEGDGAQSPAPPDFKALLKRSLGL